MSSASGPGLLVAVGEMTDLAWRQIARSKQLIGIGLAILFAVGMAYVIYRDAGSNELSSNYQFLQIFLLSAVVVPLIALLFGTGALASERESGTLTYLFTRPFPRAAVVLGKGLGAIVGANLAVLVTVLLVYLASGAPARGQIGGGIGALLFETTALTAVFVLFGTIVPKSLYLGLAYIALFEGFAGNTLGMRGGWTVTYHARNLLSEWSSDAIRGDPDVAFLTNMPGSAGDSMLALLLVTVGALAAAATWVETREYGLRDRSKEE